MNNNPYISFVVVARNDNYGGDFLYRTNIFVKNLLTLCEKCGVNSELIIVEWNPPEDRPRLKDAISWPDIQRKYCQVRIMEVPNELHKKLPNSNKFPLFEYIGKNVGVRHAKGEYILTTNPDIIFSEELIKFLAQRKLSSGCFYRINRYDVKTPVPVDISVEEALEYCARNIVSVHNYWYSYDGRLSKMLNLRRCLRSIIGTLKRGVLCFPFVPPHTSGPGDFFLMSRKHWSTLKGFQEFNGAPHHIDSYMVNLALFSKLRQFILRPPLQLYHQDHGRLESGKPYSPEVKSAYKQMVRRRKPLIFNNEDWGLNKEIFPEHIV